MIYEIFGAADTKAEWKRKVERWLETVGKENMKS
jgi:hypothetical protein